MKKSNIIATIIFVLLSIACIIAITTCTKTPTIQDGIWTGSGEGFKGEMTIQITTKDGKIVDTELLSIKDSDFAKEYALKLLDTIEEKGTVEGVDALSGATYTSRGVLDAVKDATQKASEKKTKAKIQDGNWTGSGNGFKGEMTVQITTKDGKIVDTELLSIKDSDFAKEYALKLLDTIKENGTVDGVDAISGATYTSRGVLDAVKDATKNATGKNEKSKDSYSDTETDIVVIGAGGAGLSAAVEANSKGMDVIVLEKMPIAGGNTNYATGGLNASETSVQKKLGIKDSNKQFYEDTMSGGKNINDSVLVETMVENSSDTVDWLLAMGADLNDVGKMAGSTNNRTHRPTGGDAIGSHLVQVLENQATKQGIDIRYNNKVTSLIDDTGKVAGVIVETPNGNYKINSKAVIIATGGFGANPEIIVSYKPNLKGFGTTNHAGATGDALTWITDFNGDVVDMEQIQTHPTVVPEKNIMITEAVRGNGAIMINRDGKRFGSEMATRDVMSDAILKQKGKTAFLVFDQGVRDSLKAIEGYASQGLLTEGKDLKELAEKLKIDAKEFESSIKKYNQAVETGIDEEFGRKASEMPRKIEIGPFYAVEVGPAVHHTMGGIKINADTQVLDKNGNVIPGLYAAGEVTGGVHGANRLGGNAVADITVFGKIAGDKATEYVEIVEAE